MRRTMNRILRSFTVESNELDCLPFSYMEGSPYLRVSFSYTTSMADQNGISKKQ
jgi:hypothetical protein